MKFIFKIQRFASLSNSRSSTLVSGTSADDTIYTSGSYVTVDGGAGNDSIKSGSSSYSVVNGGADSDTIRGYFASSTIQGGAGNDLIAADHYWSNKVPYINGGDGNDTITNDSSGTHGSIDGGAGNDLLKFKGYGGPNGSTINGGDGNDTLQISYMLPGSALGVYIVDGGAGDDIVSLSSSSASGKMTVNGGKGNDTMYSSSAAELYTYAKGDGNDTIYGFSNKDTIKVTNAKIKSTVVSGRDIIINVGGGQNAGTITLKDAATLTSPYNFIGGDEPDYWWIDTDEDGNRVAYYGDVTDKKITVSGIANNAKDTDFTLDEDNNVVKVAKGALNNVYGNVTVSDGYTLALESGVTAPTEIPAGWTFSSGTGTYKAAGKTAGYVVSNNGKTISYSSAVEGATLLTVTGLNNSASASNVSLNTSSKVVTLNGAALDSSKTVKISNGYTLALASDVTKPADVAAAWSVSNGTATYTGVGKTAGYALASDNKSVSYSAAVTGTELIKISGLNSSVAASNGQINGISINGNVVTIAQSLAGTNGLTVNGSGYVFNSEGKLTIGGSASTLIGGTAADEITNKGNAINVSGGAGNDTINNAGLAATINAGGGDDELNLKGGEGIIKYSLGDGDDTIYDYNAANTLSVDAAYSKTTDGRDVIIKVGSGSVRLVNYVDKPISIIDQSGNFKSETVRSGESLDDIVENHTYEETAIRDTNSTPNNTYVKLSDVGGSVVTITEDASGEKEYTAGEGGDTLINYSKAAKVTLNGNNGNDTLVTSGKYTTINGSKGDDVISIEGGNALIEYTENDGKDVIYGYDTNATLHILTQGGYESTFKGNDVIITVADRKNSTITLKDMVDKPIIINVNTYTTVDTISVGPRTHYEFNTAGTAAFLAADFEGTFDAEEDFDDYPNLQIIDGSAVTQNSIKIIGNSKANEIAGGSLHDYLEGGTGNDSLSGFNGDDTLVGGIGSDTLTGGAGRDVFVYNSGDGNDVITDYGTGKDTLQINNAEIKMASVSGEDVILGVGTNYITLKGANGKELTIVNEQDDIVTVNYSDELVINDDDEGLVEVEDFFKGVDASARTKPVLIRGNSQNNNFKGGAKADTLYGGAGKDYLFGDKGKDVLYGQGGADSLDGGAGDDVLTGGKGKDVFMVGSGQGNDVITDYVSGEDKIYLKSGLVSKAIKEVEIVGSAKDVILKFNSGSVTIQDGKDKPITLADSKGNETVMTFTDPVIEDLTIDDFDDPYLKLDDVVKTVDATERNNEMRIVGNALDNTILGGAGANTINGGKGNDYIEGGKGADSLLGAAGNDTLTGGAGADILDGGAGNDVIDGGKGKDIITGGKGNDTLTGGAGAGANTYVYANGDGDDVITDFKSSDQIRITEGSYSTLRSGTDLVVKVGSGSITLQKAYGISPRIVSAAEYEERWFMEGDDKFASEEGDDLESITNVSSASVTDKFNNYNLASSFELTEDDGSVAFNYTKKSDKK